MEVVFLLFCQIPVSWVDLQHLKFPYDGLMVAQKVEKVDDVSVKQLHEVLRMEI